MNLFRSGRSVDLVGGPGNDTLGANALCANLFGGRGNDTLIFSSPNPASAGSLYGGYGNDILIGGGGSSYMRGGPGNDVLVGWSSYVSDMFGGPGCDTFVVGPNYAMIEDFRHGVDRIQVERGSEIVGHQIYNDGQLVADVVTSCLSYGDLIFA